MFSLDTILYIKDLIQKNYIKLVILTFIIYVIQFLITCSILIGYSNYTNNLINLNIDKYMEVDYVQLCKISNCKEVWDENKHYVFRDTNLNEINYTKPNFVFSKNGLSVTSDFDFVIYNKQSNANYMLDTEEIENLVLNTSMIVTPLIFVILFGFLAVSLKEERELALRALAGNEALLANKSMILITENIHHELNTPMEVIDNKIYKLQKILDDYLLNEYNSWCQYKMDYGEECDFTYEHYKSSERRNFNKKILSLEEDFNYIKQSSEQIYAVLERMRGFKHLRYSNGNKSLANIIEGAFKVISISNSNFTFEVDPELRKYSLNSESFKNADLLNVLLNHIKNSLEANSNKIHVTFNGFKGRYVKIRIIDNGNGIPEKNKDSIFSANFSTKIVGDTGIRGNGLYLNKSILKSDGGNVKLVDSSTYGTTFELKIPAKTGKWARLYE